MLLAKKTFLYLKKSFLVLLAVSSLPAVACGFFGSPFASITFLPDYYQAKSGGFVYFFNLLMSGKAMTHIYPLVLMLVAIVFSTSLALSIIEKHFKTGRLRLAEPFKSVNNSMLSVVQVLPVALLVCALTMLLQTGLTTLIYFIFSRSDTVVTYIASNIFVSLFSVLIYLVMLLLTVFMGVWVVIIQIFGFSIEDAFFEAVRVVSKKWLLFFGFLFVVVTVLLVPQIVVNALIKNWVIRTITSTLTHALIFVFYAAYVMVSVYTLSNLERRDEKTLVPKS